MINEICQFVNTLKADAPQLFEEGSNLKEGIYVALDIGFEDNEIKLRNVDKDGMILNEDVGVYKKKSEMTPFFYRCQQVLQYSQPVDKNKIFNPNLKIFNLTCSPYALGFSKKGISSNIEKRRKDGSIVGKEGIVGELTKQYFKKAEEYTEEGLSKVWFEAFKKYITINFWSLLDNVDFKELKESSTIIFFLKTPSVEDYKKPYLKYLGQNVFNKDEYNISWNDIIFGVSDSLNTFNNKKLFLQHQSASFRYNYRINGEIAQLIWNFYKLSNAKKFPNPLPIFVDKDEADLNTDVIQLFNNERTIIYSEIIRSLLEKRKKNLQNLYLLFIQKGEIVDLDFVPMFKYTLKDKENNDFVIKELFNREPMIYFQSKKNNVFDFQIDIINNIFNNQLISSTKTGGLWIKYFDDIEIKPQYGLTDTIYNLIYKYRYAWYSFVYKSMQQDISMTMIDDMCKYSILDDIHRDKEMKNTFQIRRKLSIWFGLQPVFDNHFKTNNMANKIQELQKKFQDNIRSESFHIETDDEFAFAAGQIIWKLLIQSESANRTHALLEPFLQKTDPILLKQAIANTFNTYKHNFVLYLTKYEFDKLFSEVMGYIPDNTNMKDHLPMILAGYFSESLFKIKKDNN